LQKTVTDSNKLVTHDSKSPVTGASNARRPVTGPFPTATDAACFIARRLARKYEDEADNPQLTI